jgi:pyridoxal phosphate enzyme (YggS family)
MQQTINEKYLGFLEEIERCAVNCRRSSSEIQLVVVTKGQPVEMIKQAIEAGATILGENYPEETIQKIPKLQSKAVKWHMIGHLQSRKVKYVAEEFAMIHSIDRHEIATKLNERLISMNRIIPALFEVNLSGEESKSGFSAWDEKAWDSLVVSFQSLIELENLHFVGLMTMPPYSENPESSRDIFKKCRKLLEIVQKKTTDPEFTQLSMGTSLDYEVAIQEGATYLRIGQAIMGERSYLKGKLDIITTL